MLNSYSLGKIEWNLILIRQKMKRKKKITFSQTEMNFLYSSCYPLHFNLNKTLHFLKAKYDRK